MPAGKKKVLLFFWTSIRVVMQNRLDIITQEHIGCIYVKDEDTGRKLSLWSRKKIGDVHQNTIEWIIKLQSLEEIDMEVNTKQSRQDVNKAHVEYIHWMKLQESIPLQKSQCKWFEEGYMDMMEHSSKATGMLSKRISLPMFKTS
ncbi:hypothetical protein MTR67_003588 [Solanum verrucosum]|uniref:Uncharacterized protein n=1 Tax=Solanum verrucosum TaxID=315347 RepID=A0AAF0PSR9_SOLVR|nr:hypothetical protein MTR67_003588 [Solanum verrucosum]